MNGLPSTIPTHPRPLHQTKATAGDQGPRECVQVQGTCYYNGHIPTWSDELNGEVMVTVLLRCWLHIPWELDPAEACRFIIYSLCGLHVSCVLNIGVGEKPHTLRYQISWEVIKTLQTLISKTEGFSMCQPDAIKAPLQLCPIKRELRLLAATGTPVFIKDNVPFTLAVGL